MKGKDGRLNPSLSDLSSPNILNTKLLNDAALNHLDLDSWIPPVGINVSQVIGLGLPTLQTVKYLGKQNCLIFSIYCTNKYSLDHEPIYNYAGDKTVLDFSASGIAGANNYYLNLSSYNKTNNKSIDHTNILEIEPMQNLIGNIITNNKDLSNYISGDKPIFGRSITVSVHSPVLLDIYDSQGRHTGLKSNPNLIL